MAVSNINRIALPETAAGYNLTDSADFTTMSSGAGNGVQFDYGADDVIVLKNDSGTTRVYTFLIVVPTNFTSYSAAVTNPTLSVANGKTYFARLNEAFKNASSKVNIECDGAGKILVATP